jgi:PknH-like extracellular domain
MQFDHTGFTAVREQNITSAGKVVGEDALQYASPDDAAKVVDSLAASWEACRGKPITQTPEGSSGPLTIQEVVTGQHKLSARITVPSYRIPNYVCQHLAESVSVFIIDVIACGSNVTNQAETIASRIAAKISR